MTGDDGRAPSAAAPRAAAGVASLLVLLTPAPALAGAWGIHGARYQGMGGAGVATVNDSHATYWNPAALAYGSRWSLVAPLSVNASSEKNALETLDFIIELADEFGPISRKVSRGQELSRSDSETLLELIRGFENLEPDGEGLLVNAEAGFRGTVSAVGLAGVAMTETAIQPAKDDLNLQLSVDSLGPVQQVFNVVRAGADHSAGSSRPFDQIQSQRLADRIAASNAAWSQDQAEELVFRAERAGFDMGHRGERQILAQAARDTGRAGNESITLNETGGFVRGIVTTEIGLGYGRAFEVPYIPGEVAFGIVPKIIIGTTYFDFIRWDEVDSFGDAVDRLLSGPTVRTSVNFGLDLGFMARPIDRFSFGVTARNVNQPSFQFDGNGRYTVDPQVRSGISYGLTERWLIAFDADLTVNETEAITGFKSRQVAFGTEYRIPIRALELALRGGVYNNVARQASNETALTFGFSVARGGFSIDLAGGSAFTTANVDDLTLPERVNFALSARYEKRF